MPSKTHPEELPYDSLPLTAKTGKKRLDLKTVGVFCASKGTRYNCTATSNT